MTEAAEFPWDGIRVAFSVQADEEIMYAWERGELVLPDGWELETITHPSPVAMFIVEGVTPTVEDGHAVRASLDAIENRNAPAP